MMNRMKKKTIKVVFCFCTVLMLSNCKETVSQDVIGNYISVKDTYTTKLALFDNGRFEYSHKEKLAKKVSKGKWLKEGNNIILNNDLEFTKGVKESTENLNEVDKGKIIIKDTNNDPIVFAGITINGDNTVGWNTNELGIVEIPSNTKIDKITVYFLNNQYSYEVKNNKNNSFELKIKLYDSSIKYFHNENFFITKKGIKDSDRNLLLKE